MQFMRDLVDESTEEQVKNYLEERLKLLYREQGSTLDEWNDAIDSAIRVVVRS